MLTAAASRQINGFTEKIGLRLRLLSAIEAELSGELESGHDIAAKSLLITPNHSASVGKPQLAGVLQARAWEDTENDDSQRTFRLEDSPLRDGMWGRGKKKKCKKENARGQ